MLWALVSLSFPFLSFSQAASISHENKLSKRSVTGPVINIDFADPSVIQLSDGYYVAYATTGNGKNIQMAHSHDFDSWEVLNDTRAMPYKASDPPNWIDSTTPAIWAPDVIELETGKYAMTYSGTVQNTSKHCIGVSISEGALGPFYKTSNQSFVCPLEEGGTIDSSYFRDEDSKLYIVYKIDGNSMGKDTIIKLQQVDSTDGYTKIGESFELLRNGTFDGGIVEAPAIIKRNEVYFLFFSSNWYNSDSYDISYAYSEQLKQKFEKSDIPLLETGDYELGAPGGATPIRTQDGSYHLVFHANKGGPGHAGAERLMYTAHISLSTKSSPTVEI